MTKDEKEKAFLAMPLFGAVILFELITVVLAYWFKW